MEKKRKIYGKIDILIIIVINKTCWNIIYNKYMEYNTIKLGSFEKILLCGKIPGEQSIRNVFPIRKETTFWNKKLEKSFECNVY